MQEGNQSCRDEQLQSMLARLRKQNPVIQCPSGNYVTKLCTNPHCKNSLRCNENNCKTCGKEAHPGCLSLNMEEITELINGRIEDCKQILMCIVKVEEQFIKNIQNNRSEFVEQFIMGDLKMHNLQSIKKIYVERSFDAMSGKRASQMCQELQKRLVINQQEQRARVYYEYTNELSELVEKINELRSYFYKTKETGKSMILVTPSKPQITIDIDSEILRLKDNLANDTEYLLDMLKHPKSFDLLYRGSKQNFSVANFHQKCDGFSNTLTLIRTEYGKTIAGYTFYPWKSHLNQYFRGDQDKVFLLQLDLHEKFVPKNNNNLIYCHQDYGPTFGGTDATKHDIALIDQCHKKETTTYYQWTYTPENGTKISRRQFCGVGNNFFEKATFQPAKFKIIEYEVFRLNYD